MKTILFAFMLITTATFAQKKAIILYPHGVPNSKPAPASYADSVSSDEAVRKVTNPTLTPFLAAKPNGTAVIICPGGGYEFLSMGNEGPIIAKAFNSIGVTAFVLRYRLPSDKIMVDKTIGPLQDAQRAMQIVRERAAEWGVDPKKVGIIGFSAGGHLASTVITHFDKPVIENKNNTNLRPDFGILIYPVISMGPKTHLGSKEMLLGKNPSQELANLYSNEMQVTANTPPTFLIAAEDDDTVPVENTLMFYQALLNNKVKAEMHIYQAGGHGFGLYNLTTKDLWFDRLKNWMDENGWLGNK